MPRPRLPHAALAAACCFFGLSCTGLVSGDDKPVAIQVVGAPGTMAVNDTIVIEVHVLNRGGDSIPGAPIELVTLTPDTLGVDPGRQALVGKSPGPGKWIARSGTLPSVTFQTTVQ